MRKVADTGKNFCDVALRRNVEGRIHQTVQGGLPEQHCTVVKTPSSRRVHQRRFMVLEKGPSLSQCVSWVTPGAYRN